MHSTRVLFLDQFGDDNLDAVRHAFPSVSFREILTRNLMRDDLTWATVAAGWDPAKTALEMPNVEWVHYYTAGVDHGASAIARLPATTRLTNSRGAYDDALTEHLLALGFALTRRIDVAVRAMTDARWGDTGEPNDVRGMTVGVVGLGSIGSRYAAVMHGLGARVLGWKRRPIDPPDGVESVCYGPDGLDEIVGQSDLVAICLPGTDETRRLFDAARIARIKPGATLLNIGRGYIVDTDALVAALESGHLAGAGLDVTDPEPLPGDSPLWSMDNVVITPHTGGRSRHGSRLRKEVFVRNLHAFLEGDTMPGTVDGTRGY